MSRLYMSLLPLPVIAAVVVFSSCSHPHDDASTHVIPPANGYTEPAAQNAAQAAAAPRPPAETPSTEEVKAFERPVLK